MRLGKVCLVFAALIAGSIMAGTMNAGDAGTTKIIPVKQWRGVTWRVMDGGAVRGPESVRYVDGECVLNESELRSIWEFWEIKEELPRINFEEEFAVIALTHGIPVLANAPFLEGGNLNLSWVQKPVWEPMPYYLLTSFERSRITHVNGQALTRPADVQPTAAPDALRR